MGLMRFKQIEENFHVIDPRFWSPRNVAGTAYFLGNCGVM